MYCLFCFLSLSSICRSICYSCYVWKFMMEKWKLFIKTVEVCLIIYSLRVSLYYSPEDSMNEVITLIQFRKKK